jgi:hypothetical protein
MASKRLVDKEKDLGFKAYYQWQLDTYNAALNPVFLLKETLGSYVGIYGPRKITLEDDSLFYQREGQAKRRMTAIGDADFVLEGNENFRLRFLKEGARIVAVEGYTPAGAADKHLKNK